MFKSIRVRVLYTLNIIISIHEKSFIVRKKLVLIISLQNTADKVILIRAVVPTETVCQWPEKEPTSLSYRNFHHLKALMPYAGTHKLLLSFKGNFVCTWDFTLSQHELGMQAMKKSDSEIVCRAHDRVGFFSPFSMSLTSHRITKYLCS